MRRTATLIGSFAVCLFISGCGRPVSLICQGTVRDYNNGAPDPRTAKAVDRFVVALKPYDDLARQITGRYGKITIYKPRLRYFDVQGPQNGSLTFGEQERDTTSGRINIASGLMTIVSDNDYYTLKCISGRRAT